MHAQDLKLLEKMAATWPKRATVRADFSRYAEEYTDPERRDYPLELLPFRDHPGYLSVSPEQKQRIDTWAWLVYNDRTIQSEEYLANPAFTCVMHDVFPGADPLPLRQAVQQCLIDEHFHTFMHLTAVAETRQFRHMHETLNCPLTITYRCLKEAQEQAPELWQKQLLTLVFGIVAEVSVKAYLNLIAQNEEIQPKHKMVALFHNRDESAHGQILVPVAKRLWSFMNNARRDFFIRALPKALSAFMAQDFSAWLAILQHEEVPKAQDIIADCQQQAEQSKILVRDVSGIRQLTDELDITERLDFDFSLYQAAETPCAHS